MGVAHKVMTIALMALMFTPALAQEDLPDPGILPTSPIYGFKKGWERAIDVITFDPESKSRLHYQYALTRLAEADALADTGNTDLIEGVVDDYEEEMNYTEEYLNETGETEGTNETDSNVTGMGIGSRVSEFMKSSNMTWEKHLFVLQLVSEKVPPQAALVIQRNINRTLEKRYGNETIREKVREKIHNKERIESLDELVKPEKPQKDGKGPQTTNGAKGEGQENKPDQPNRDDGTNKGGSSSRGSSGGSGKGK